MLLFETYSKDIFKKIVTLNINYIFYIKIK